MLLSLLFFGGVLYTFCLVTGTVLADMKDFDLSGLALMMPMVKTTTVKGCVTGGVVSTLQNIQLLAPRNNPVKEILILQMRKIKAQHCNLFSAVEMAGVLYCTFKYLSSRIFLLFRITDSKSILLCYREKPLWLVLSQVTFM